MTARPIVSIERVPARDTYVLRQRVLRPHETLEQLQLPGDDDPDAGHFAATDPGTKTVVGTASVRREAPPWAHDGPAWRLRGMATDDAWRGRGVGSLVLDAVLDHVAQHGGGLVWCNARTPARVFYERAGFVTRGDEWIDPDIGPHVAMHREVAT